jgi:hypothetical protein
VGIDPSIFRIFRIFRVMRVFRLVKRLKRLRQIFQTLFFSLPALLNVGLLICLILFLFSVLGMNFFGDIVRGTQINSFANFNNFANAYLTLYRMMTGENWNAIMSVTLTP